jgi:hypothetical protein
MTREVSGWAVAGVLAVLIVSMGAMQQAARVGRFQLVLLNQRVGFLGDDGEVTTQQEQQMTLLLDTETGDTRQLLYMVGKGGLDANYTAPFGPRPAPVP